MITIEQAFIILWLVVFVASLIFEALTCEIISVWFSAGSLISLLIGLIPGVPYYVEIAIFFVVSISTLLFLRPLANKYLQRRKSNTNIDSFVGKRSKLLKGIDDDDFGEIKINGLVWTALSSDDSPIKQGELVEVISISGNKLYVKKVND